MECMDQILTFIVLNQYIFFPTENDDASLQFKHSCQVHFIILNLMLPHNISQLDPD